MTNKNNDQRKEENPMHHCKATNEYCIVPRAIRIENGKEVSYKYKCPFCGYEEKYGENQR